MKIRDVKAHCDIPCAVYDPGVAQYAALSVLRFLDLNNLVSKAVLQLVAAVS